MLVSYSKGNKMKTIFDHVEKALDKIYLKADKAKSWAASKLPQSMKSFDAEKHPRLAKLKDDLGCVIYFTFFRLILTMVVLPVVCVVLPIVGIYKLAKSKFKTRKEKKKA